MESAPSLLRVYLLGRFEVVREDAPIPAQAWRRRRPADLLKLVALAPSRTVSREQALDALWPDKDPSSGANNLHRALYDLRQILGGRFVDVDRGTIRMKPGVWLDVDAFERAVEAGGKDGWALAASLYRGPLSPEDPASPWLAQRRASLRARFADAALPLAEDAAARGDAATAIPLLRRLLEAAADREDAHALLMRLLAGSGRRAEALRQFDACEAALRAAGLGAPAPATRALRDAIQRGALGAASGRPALDPFRRAARRLLGTTEPPPLRGRGPSLLLVESLVESGAGALVFLGERGVGKTRLAVEAARIAQSHGARVLTGLAAGRGGAAAPYALFADLFRDDARAHPAHPDPFAEEPGTASHEAARRRVVERVRAALRTAADGAPLCVVLDDIHLADESSLNLLHFLALEARALRLVLLCTCREDAVLAGSPVAMALAHLDCERLGRGVRVPRLGLAATREQIADLLGAPPPEALVAQVYAVTDGAPFLTEEVVRAHREAGTIPSGGAAAAIRARAARLGAHAGAVLAAAAVVGTRFDFDAIRPVCGLTAHDALEALDRCVDVHLLDEDGAGYAFHNALAREAILEALPPDRAAALHAAAADALEATAAQSGQVPLAPEAIAWHRRQAGQPERALRHLVAAGHRAAARAGLREAVGFYAEALGILDAQPGGRARPERAELLDAMGRAQLGLGELAGAAGTFEAAAAGAEPARQARLGRLLASARVAAGDLRAAGATIAAALGVAASCDDAAEERAPLHHLRSQLLWHAGEDPAARAEAERCVEAARAAGDAELVRRGEDLVALADAGALAPEAPGGEPAGQETSPDHPLDVHLVLWERDLLGDRTVADVVRAAERIVERARHRGAAGALASGLTGLGVAALAAGRLDVADAHLREAIAAHRAAGSALGEALALERLATLLGLRGELDAALAIAAEGIVIAERGDLRRHALARLHATEARNRLAAGAPYAAEDALREASETLARHGPCVTCDAAFRPEAVRVALARGRLDAAEAEAAALEEIAGRHGGRGLRSVARLARARVLAARGRTEDALGALDEARSGFAAGGLLFEAARCVRLGTRVRGSAPADPELRALDLLVRVDADA